MNGNGLDLQPDHEAQARAFGGGCLKVLAHIAHNEPDPAIRDCAWRSLQHALTQVRQFMMTTADDAARQDAREALKAFLDS
jgi:hypothetical protein